MPAGAIAVAISSAGVLSLTGDDQPNGITTLKVEAAQVTVTPDATGIPAIKRAVHDFLCASPAALVGLSLDDLGGETEPVNVPGVGVDRFPCWSRKMRHTITEIAATSTEDLSGCTNRARRL